MSDWVYIQAEPAEQLMQLFHFSIMKQQSGRCVPFNITIKEFAVPPPGQRLRVYAEADNPYTSAPASWWRLDAVVSGRTLTVTRPAFIATYEMDDEGQLKAFFKGSRIARAAMSRTDLASLTKPGAVVAWSRGTSELLQTDLVEDGNPVRLETVIFKPPGPGPFPLAVFNHGSTGGTPTPELARQSWASLEIADFLNSRGWLVAFPQRRGRGKSDGFDDEEFSRNGKPENTCDTGTALGGADRAMADIDAAIDRFEDAAIAKPGYAMPFRFLGEAQEKKGLKKKAIKSYQRYLDLLPHAEDKDKIQKKIDKLYKEVEKENK